MSVRGPKSQAIDEAVEVAVASGITVVVAAGNEDMNACLFSPAHVEAVITVGATSLANRTRQDSDFRSSFSNFGPCVDILAPGSFITSAWIGSPNAVMTLNGTSMATPLVTGAATAYVANFPRSTPSEVKKYLSSESTEGVIDLACAGNEDEKSCAETPNKMLFWNCHK
jgi:serine protease